MAFPDERRLERDKIRIRGNSFDARSGGHHSMKLRALLDRPESNCVLHPVQTRDAVIDYSGGTKLCKGFDCRERR